MREFFKYAMYLISYFMSDNIDKMKEIESRLKNHNNVEINWILCIPAISTTKLS